MKIELPGESKNWVKLKDNQGWKNNQDNTIWKKDKLHQVHYNKLEKKIYFCFSIINSYCISKISICAN